MKQTQIHFIQICSKKHFMPQGKSLAGIKKTLHQQSKLKDWKTTHPELTITHSDIPNRGHCSSLLRQLAMN